jgi:hypothetical protein
MFKRWPRVAAVIALAVLPAFGQSSLFFLEVQGVAGYSFHKKGLVFYSLSQMDAMQKPSLGFDYIKKLTGKTRDYGTVAVQARLAYTNGAEKKLEFQLYNAYLKLKAGFADLWIGHNRPSLGLSSVLDSHALLLPALAMMGFGFDRDWGFGAGRDFPWGNASFSLTTGSGMPLRLEGNYLVSARVSKGVLSRDNYSLGLSLAHGDILETMGNYVISSEPAGFRFVSADISYFLDNIENRLEVLAGEKNGRSAYALFWRFGINLLEEGRLKLELQPVLYKTEGKWISLVSTGASYQLSADLTARAMAQYDRATMDTRIIFQVYFYRLL